MREATLLSQLLAGWLGSTLLASMRFPALRDRFLNGLGETPHLLEVIVREASPPDDSRLA